MKIAITSEGNSLNSNLDAHFGRCSYFVFYDTETGKTDFIVNPAKEATEGAGPAAVQFIGSKKVEKVISGEFGLKIKSLLESLNIEMQREHDKTIAEIIQALKKIIIKKDTKHVID